MTTSNTLLDPEQRRTLQGWCRSTSAAQGPVTRARILLSIDRGDKIVDIARAHGVSLKTVHKWRNRFLAEGVDGLLDQPRPGRPSVIDAETVERVLTLTTRHAPRESTHWSGRLMATYAGTTLWQVQQIWRAAGLKPHLYKTFKISDDPTFAEKVTDIVGLYMDPPTNAVVLSVNEKTQI